jgi:hypothetical protein
MERHRGFLGKDTKALELRSDFHRQSIKLFFFRVRIKNPLVLGTFPLGERTVLASFSAEIISSLKDTS